MEQHLCPSSSRMSTADSAEMQARWLRKKIFAMITMSYTAGMGVLGVLAWLDKEGEHGTQDPPKKKKQVHQPLHAAQRRQECGGGVSRWLSSS